MNSNLEFSEKDLKNIAKIYTIITGKNETVSVMDQITLEYIMNQYRKELIEKWQKS